MLILALSACGNPDLDMAGALVREGNCAEAMPLLERIVAADPDQARAQALLAQCLHPATEKTSAERAARMRRGFAALKAAVRLGWDPNDAGWTAALLAEGSFAWDPLPVGLDTADRVTAVHGTLEGGAVVATLRRTEGTVLALLDEEGTRVIYDPEAPPAGSELGSRVSLTAFPVGDAVWILAQAPRGPRAAGVEVWTWREGEVSRAGAWLWADDVLDAFALDGEELLAFDVRNPGETAPNVLHRVNARSGAVVRRVDVSLPGILTRPALDPHARRILFSVVGEQPYLHAPYPVELWALDPDASSAARVADLQALTATIGGVKDPKWWFRSGATAGFGPEPGTTFLGRPPTAVRWTGASSEQVHGFPAWTPGSPWIHREEDYTAWRSDWKRWQAFQGMARARYGTPAQWRAALGVD